MGRILKLGISISLLLLSFLIKAQEKGKCTYFLVDNISSESYSAWISSLSVEERQKVSFTCIPAKIIGIEKEFIEKFISTSRLWNSNVTKLEMSNKEAEFKCAKQREL